jgi:hypothetical protein
MADYNGGQPRAQFRSFWSHAKICRNWHGRKLWLGFGRRRPILFARTSPRESSCIDWGGPVEGGMAVVR